MIIEDVPVGKSNHFNGLTEALRAMKIGQSVYSDRSYQIIHSSIRQAKKSVRSPLVGQFAIVPEGSGYRVGRVG